MAAVAVLGCVAIASLIESDHTPYRWSMATAYVGLAFMAATLLTGPINLLRKQANPMSTDLRRDLGIWACMLGAAHTVVGLQVHMKSMWLYFFNEVSGPKAWSLRSDQFGAANYTGLVGVLLLLFLAALSNDLSLRRFGVSRWKNLQRWNYALFAVVIAHAVLYQLIEKRSLPWPVMLGALVAPILAVQMAGVWVTMTRARKGSETDPAS
jgi:sulfoxide reductase heme-binding subunit YedZ